MICEDQIQGDSGKLIHTSHVQECLFLLQILYVLYISPYLYNYQDVDKFNPYYSELSLTIANLVCYEILTFSYTIEEEFAIHIFNP